MLYKIVYCFTDKYGMIEEAEDGNDLVYIDFYEAKNKSQAVAKLFINERFLNNPDILQVKECVNI